MKTRYFLLFTVLLLASMVLTTGAPAGAQSSELPRNQTLYIAGLQWQTPVNFNPLNNNPDWPASSQRNLLFETLFAYNQVTGNLDPILGKSLKWADKTTLDITLQDGTMWQDGQ